MPELPPLRRAYAERNCTLLVVTVLREPVSHLVSDFFFSARFLGTAAKRQRSQILGGDGTGRSANRSLLEHAKKYSELQMMHLACTRPTQCVTGDVQLHAGARYRPDRVPVAHVRQTLRSFDVVGETSALPALLTTLCRRLAVDSDHCPTDLAVNQARSQQTLANGAGDGAALSVDAARRLTAPGSPLHSQLLAFAPLTACVHGRVLREWRAGRVATGEDAFPESCLDVGPPPPSGAD